MSRLKGVFALVLSLGLSSAAFALPSFTGPTGLLNTPNANTLAEKAYNASINFSSADTAQDAEFAFNYGIHKNVEVGFSRLSNDETVINGKYNFQPETSKRIGLAVGVIDLTNQVQTTVYGVASKKLVITDLSGIDSVDFNLGLAAGTSDPAIHLRGLFGGMALNVANNRAAIILEDDGNTLNYGARFLLPYGFAVQAGFVGEDHPLVAGVSYSSHF